MSQFPSPATFPQPQLPTPIPTMVHYAQPSFPSPAQHPHVPTPPPPEISPPPIPTSDQPPPPAPVPLPAPNPAPANPSQQPEQPMYKNRLQEFTQKLNIPLPVYQTVNEGFQHAPKFRSTVLVDGVKFTSPNTFWTRKAAEKDVAELALKYISQKKKDEEFPHGFPQDFPLIQEDTVFCKSILNEFATKMNIEIPTYNTIKAEGLLPVFISSLVFNGVSYTGSAGKNKKEAEQLAARAVILSLMGDSKMGKVLCDIIKSKVKLYAAMHKVNNPTSTTPLVINTVHSPAVARGKDVGAEVIVPVNSALVTADSSLAVPIGNVPPKHDFRMVKPESSVEATNAPALASEATKLPIEFVHPTSAPCVATGPSLSKKRRKNRKKANKRLCTSAELPMADLPLNQAPPCSVAQ